jgi:hypothetical protein
MMKILLLLPLTTCMWLHDFVCRQSFPHFVFHSLDGKDVVDLEHTDNDESESHQDSYRSKQNTKPARKHNASVIKKGPTTPTVELEDDDE